MMTVTFKQDMSRLNTLDKVVPTNADNITRSLAQSLASEIKDNWSPESPSSAYEPPAVVTGTLDRSVKVEPTGRDLRGRFSKEASMWTVRVGAPYAGFLEHGTSKMAPRTFVLPAVGRVAERLSDAYRDVFSFKIIERLPGGDDDEPA